MRAIPRLLIIFLACTLSHAAELSQSGSIANAKKVEFRGVLASGNSHRFILTDGEGNFSGWMKLNQQVFGYTIVDFSASNETVTLENRADKKRTILGLSRSPVGDQKTAVPVPAPAPATIISAELPPDVRAAMFPDPTAPRPPMLAHPKDAAPSGDVKKSLLPETARYFPSTPGPKWNHPGEVSK